MQAVVFIWMLFFACVLVCIWFKGSGGRRRGQCDWWPLFCCVSDILDGGIEKVQRFSLTIHWMLEINSCCDSDQWTQTVVDYFTLKPLLKPIRSNQCSWERKLIIFQHKRHQIQKRKVRKNNVNFCLRTNNNYNSSEIQGNSKQKLCFATTSEYSIGKQVLWHQTIWHCPLLLEQTKCKHFWTLSPTQSTVHGHIWTLCCVIKP